MIGIEGLQTLKPQVHTMEFPVSAVGEADMKKVGGVNVEAHMVVSEDDFDHQSGNWTVENHKFSVEQPVEAVVTKNELHHLAFLCKSEVDSVGRLAASTLRVLKLEGSIGEGAINQLNNLECFPECC